MEELAEKRIWQRVRGDGDITGRVRALLADQGPLLGTYRNLSRRGGSWRRLWELKEAQVASLRGLLRLLTGQIAAKPRPGTAGDLSTCFTLERKFLGELRTLSQEGEIGDLAALLLKRQQELCRLELELLGTM